MKLKEVKIFADASTEPGIEIGQPLLLVNEEVLVCLFEPEGRFPEFTHLFQLTLEQRELLQPKVPIPLEPRRQVSVYTLEKELFHQLTSLIKIEHIGSPHIFKEDQVYIRTYDEMLSIGYPKGNRFEDIQVQPSFFKFVYLLMEAQHEELMEQEKDNKFLLPQEFSVAIPKLP